MCQEQIEVYKVFHTILMSQTMSAFETTSIVQFILRHFPKIRKHS